MFEMYAMLACVIILIMLVLYYVNSVEYLAGTWVGDSEFMEQSGLMDFIIVLDEPCGRTFDGVIYMKTADEEIISDVALRVDRTFSGAGMYQKHFSAVLTLEDATADIIPRNVEIDYDIITGRMKLSSENKVYGAFIKNHAI